LLAPSSLWRYHGAEHKAVAAYEAGVDLADVDAVLAAPRVHDRCGTNLAVLVVLVSPALLRLSALAQLGAVILLLAGLAEMMTVAAGRPDALASRLLLGGGKAVQRWLTTAEPTPAEQVVGCLALHAALAHHAAVEAAEATSAAVPTLAAA